MSDIILTEQAEQADEVGHKIGRSLSRIFLTVLFISLAAALLWIGSLSRLFLSPEAVIENYVTSLYAQDYPTAYKYISTVDKGFKSEIEYTREKVSYDGFAQIAISRLATFIEFQSFLVEMSDNKATATVTMVIPDSNDPAVREILFAAPRSQDLPQADQQRLLQELQQLYETDQLPIYQTEQQFELVKETAGWAVAENWAAAIQIHFSSAIKSGLPWEVEPLQEVVLARPGETLTAVYQVKNLSDQPVTAKARHLDGPAAFVNEVNIIQCFCLIQQTLQPGVEVDMPLIFQVDQDASAEMKEFFILYEFYPVENFPGE